MSLSGLAVVEKQSICHYLQASEILALARCGRLFHTMTNSGFAFRFATLDINFPPPPEAQVSHLLRHVRVRIFLSADCGKSMMLDLLQFGQSCGEVRELNAGGGTWFQPQEWERILDAECFQSIRTLVMHSRDKPQYCSAPQVRLACGLPHLTALSVHPYNTKASFDQLARATKLTTLSLTDGPGRGVSRLSHLQQCESLTNLSITHACFRDTADCTAFFSTPTIRALRALTLYKFSARRAPDFGEYDEAVDGLDEGTPVGAAFESVFQDMPVLESITLDHVTHAGNIVEHLHFARALVELRIVGDIGPRTPRTNSIPALGSLEPLLQFSSTLRRCSMVVRFSQNVYRDNGMEKADETAMLADAVAIVAQEWRQRSGGELQVSFE